MRGFMEHPILLYDGLCYLCNWIVRFALKRDPEGRLRFASLQSAAGQNLLERHGLGYEAFDTSLLLEDGRVYDRSTSALRALRYLRFPWPLLYGLIIVPPVLRDPVYDLIARNRFNWFGQMDACPIPAPEIRDRFLD